VVRCAFAILLSITALPPQSAHSQAKAKSRPAVSILLPPTIPSETVQIHYFLYGPSGGYGGFVAKKAGVHSYDIPTLAEGKPAAELKMIVYASGCEIQTFLIPLTEVSETTQNFQCQSVRTVKLSGEVVPSELVRDKNTELVITYMAYWAHEFYGISDGIVTTLQAATVSPGANGMFQVDLPYFSIDAANSSAQLRSGFMLTLRDSKTGNYIGNDLEPDVTELRLYQAPGLRIRSQYPDVVSFSEHVNRARPD
jgi:hypothetical protein